MKTILSSLILAGGLLGAADLSYVEKTQMTDGALVRMTAMLGRLAKGVTDPITTTHSYSGNKKASVSAKSHEIWDLSNETITSVNDANKEYSVITFAEMAQLAAAMAERMSQQQRAGTQPGSTATAKWNASFEKNNQTKQVAGVETHGGTLKLEMEATDTKTGQSGAMKMDIEMWMGQIPGWQVKHDFDRKAGEKLGAQAGPHMQALAQAGPAAMDAMKEAGKKIAEMGDMQLASVTRIFSDNVPNAPADTSSSSPSSSSKPAGETVNQSAQDEAARQAENEVSRRSGRFGGLGGRLGSRIGQMSRKSSSDSQPAATEAPAATASSAPAQSGGPGVLAAFTTEVVSFSSTVDPSVFQVPAGYKQVEHPMKKAFGKYAK